MSWLQVSWSSVAHAPTPRRTSASTTARVFAYCATLCAAIAVAAPVAHAQATTLTFNGLTPVDDSGIRFVNNCYEESGFRVTLVGMGCTGGGTDPAFGTWTAGNPEYFTGSPALFNNVDGAVQFTAVSGQAFSFQSIGLGSFLGSLGNETSVLFTGMLAGGGTVTRTVVVPGGMFPAPATLTNFVFTGFTNLSALQLTVTSPDVPGLRNVQFDNVVFGAAQSVVPEPATVVLFGSGMVALGLVTLRRRRAS